jgi:nucleoside phosphorylase
VINILVLEDDQPKSAKICAALAEIDGVSLEGIVTVMDAASARRELQRKFFDLVVVDIAVPWQPDGDVVRDAGERLVDELFRSEGLNMPMHVFGLTGFSELVSERMSGIPASVFSVQLFDAASDEWRVALTVRVKQIVATRAALDQQEREFNTDLAIVCALGTPELAAVLNDASGWIWQQKVLPYDPTIYFESELELENKRLKVVAAASSRMGMAAAAVATSKLISVFRPRFLAMAGIAAGVPNRVNYGDIIVADPVWDWGSGKWIAQDDDLKFQSSPHQLDLDARVRNQFRILASDVETLAGIKKSYVGPKPATELRLHVGPLASGASVLADGQTMSLILEQNRNLLGVDMEAYGVLAAVYESTLPRPTAFVAKSVVDFADSKKSDEFHEYAAHTSASIIRLFAHRYM